MKTILLVEDDPFVMNVVQSLLGASGYLVLEATSAEQALKWHGRPEHIDLVIADVSLPFRSGIQVASQLRAWLPDLKILLTSGYPPDMWPDAATLREIPAYAVRILQKPSLPKDLLQKTSELIGLPEANSRHGAATVGR
jgi:CheY-like chemotaxis protein